MIASNKQVIITNFHFKTNSYAQFIAMPEELYDKMRLRPEFMKEYIFPGGCLPSLARVVSAMTNASRLWYVLNCTSYLFFNKTSIIY